MESTFEVLNLQYFHKHDRQAQKFLLLVVYCFCQGCTCKGVAANETCAECFLKAKGNIGKYVHTLFIYMYNYIHYYDLYNTFNLFNYSFVYVILSCLKI